MTTTDKSHLIDVVALILIQNEKVLVAQRPKDDKLAMKWEFPGGKIEPGETPEVALEREIQEELGVKIKVKSYFMTSVYKANVPIRLHAYKAELVDGLPISIVHNEVRWVNLKELNQLDFAPADIPILNAIINLE